MPEAPETTPAPPPVQNAVDPEVERQRKRIILVVIIAIVLLVAILIFAVYWLLQSGTPTDKIRDIFIIFMALESLVLGAALVVLIVQLATLINLLNNEVKPILDATNETINTLRGTTEFLSENLVEPVVKLNSYLAGLQHLLDMVGLKRK